MSQNKLILASASPRRRELLARLGVAFDVKTQNVDESVLPDETPSELVTRLSLSKARAVYKDNQDKIILAADTVVALDGTIMGKPHNRNEAFAYLLALRNKTHEVFTGVSLITGTNEISQVVCTKVTFGQFSDEIIRAYVATGEGDDKAGGYAIQGQGAFLISTINGSPTNVIGLPLQQVSNLLINAGLKLFSN